MPIYEYRCSECGHEKELLQKLSDAPLTVCPACGKATFMKRISAAGFQLKGSGWYATDFRGGSKGDKKAGDGNTEGKAESKSDEAKGKTETKAKSEAKSDAKSDAPASGGGTPSA
jgi:putative FmdB family regulatory protein